MADRQHEIQGPIEDSASRVLSDATLNTTGISTDKRLGLFVGSEHQQVLEEWGKRALRSYRFRRGFESCLRALEAVSGQGDSTLEEGVKTAVTQYVTAWILRTAGMSHEEVTRQLGGEHYKPWLFSRKMPQLVSRFDPIRRSAGRDPITIPKGESGAFAYVCGAFAGSITPTSSFTRVCFRTLEQDVADRLVAALKAGCGLSPTIGKHRVGDVTYLAVNVGQKDLLGHLKAESGGNRAVPWRHVQTGEERRAFLTGFFDFTGGSIQIERGRLSFSKKENVTLLEQVGVLLAREGIYARIDRGTISHLAFEDVHEFKSLSASKLLRSERYRDNIAILAARPVAIGYRTAAEYEEFQRARETLAEETTPLQVQRAMMAAGASAELSLTVLKTWLEGHVPTQVARKENLESIERTLFSGPEGVACGPLLLARNEDLKNRPDKLVKALSEWFGGMERLARFSSVPVDVLEQIERRNRFPRPDEIGALAALMQVEPAKLVTPVLYDPAPRELMEWLPDAKVALFRTYEAALRAAMRDGVARGVDARETLFDKLVVLAGKKYSESGE